MNVSKVTELLGAIVIVALVTTVVAHPQSARIVSAAGGAFTNSLRAAMGR